MLNTGRKHLVHVVKYRWWWMALTTILLVPGIIAMIYSSVTYQNHAPMKVGIEYTGGTILRYGIENKVTNTDLAQTRANLEEKGIVIQGYLQFGRKESTQNQFKEEFGKTIESLGKNYQVVDPISSIIQLLLTLQKLVLSVLQDMTELKNKKKKESDESENKIAGAARSVQSAFSSVGNRFSDMISTLDNKCRNVTFCTGGAYNTLRSNVSQLASSLQTIAEAWDNIDYDVIVQYGALSANIGRLEDIISRLDSINSDINNILNKFKS